MKEEQRYGMREMNTCGGAQGPDPQDLEAGALLAPPSHHRRSGGSLQSGGRAEFGESLLEVGTGLSRFTPAGLAIS